MLSYVAGDAAKVKWDGIDLIQIRDGKISRDAGYSSAHAARLVGEPV